MQTHNLGGSPWGNDQSCGGCRYRAVEQTSCNWEECTFCWKYLSVSMQCAVLPKRSGLIKSCWQQPAMRQQQTGHRLLEGEGSCWKLCEQKAGIWYLGVLDVMLDRWSVSRKENSVKQLKKYSTYDWLRWAEYRSYLKLDMFTNPFPPILSWKSAPVTELTFAAGVMFHRSVVMTASPGGQNSNVFPQGSCGF